MTAIQVSESGGPKRSEGKNHSFEFKMWLSHRVTVTPGNTMCNYQIASRNNLREIFAGYRDTQSRSPGLDLNALDPGRALRLSGPGSKQVIYDFFICN